MGIFGLLSRLFLFFAIGFCATSANAYYGRHSTEAILSFTATADIQFGREATLSELNSPSSARKLALARVGEQITHLMGTFQSPSFKKEFGFLGAIGDHALLNFVKIAPGSAPGRKRVTYEYKNRSVFEKEAFKNSTTRIVPIKMPLAPDLVYGLGLVQKHNRCTDKEFSEAEYFWYYWDPDQRGCPLAGDAENIVRVKGRLERLPNTQVSYPEYDRLFGDNGNEENLDVSILIGYIGNKANRRDVAFEALRHLEKTLKEEGFAKTAKKDQSIHFYRRYERDGSWNGKKIRLRVQALLTDTGFESPNPIGMRYVVNAFENADIFFYDGHSNFGKNFDLTKMPKVRFNPNKYQIYVFNGCSTYPYWNTRFFNAKGGTKNLDIVTSGLPTFSSTSGPNMTAFLERFIEGQPRSFQTILSELEASNGDLGPYLLGVKGDEDNVWRPQN